MFSKYYLLISLLVAALSVVLYYRFHHDLNNILLKLNRQTSHSERFEDEIIKAWKGFIKPPQKQFSKIAVGVNSNIDVIVSGTDLLKALNLSPKDRKDHLILSTFDDLQETFSFFFARGSAAERAFTDEAVYRKVIETAEKLNHVEHYVGGNAALMAKKASFLFPDVKIHFVGPVGPLLEKLMPKSVEIPKSCKIDHDEIHLIMEYKVGEKWGEAEAPVATRFITSYDERNSKMLMVEPFFESIKGFNPDLLLLSGLNIMDGQSPEVFDERLSILLSYLKEIPNSVPVHLELASMANKDFMKKIVEQIFYYGASSVGLNEQELGLISIIGGGPHKDLIPSLSEAVSKVDSLGLNEQEIVFSSRATGGPHANHFDEHEQGQPEIHKISDIMFWLLKTYGRSKKNPGARLTRIHFHSLTYHIVAVVDSVWSNVDRATAAGTQVAGLQACDITHLNADQVELQMPKHFKMFTGDVLREINPKHPVLTWTKEDYKFVFSPVLVCRHPVKTVGLGDAISATGLMYSQFHSP